MPKSNRKVVTELEKVWESIVSKGKVRTYNGSVNAWISKYPSLNSLQKTVYGHIEKLKNNTLTTDFKKFSPGEAVQQKTKVKIGRIMSSYEELIGINEVKLAHSRVLSSEAKFVECQEQRRTASKALEEIQYRLTEIRQELDKTQGQRDEMYLDLVKKEIAAMKEERIMRKCFEDFERAEREAFTELSSALRFSHEKERAQNEKTKYWSVVGSIIGAALGILGTTINNKMKQNYVQKILAETTTQVEAVQEAVSMLVQKFDQGMANPSTSSLQLLEDLKSQQRGLLEQQIDFGTNIQKSVKENMEAVRQQQMDQFRIEQYKRQGAEEDLLVKVCVVTLSAITVGRIMFDIFWRP